MSRLPGARIGGAFALIDVHFARLVSRLAAQQGEDAEVLELSAALVSRERGRGHSCLPLVAVAGRSVVLGDHRSVLPPVERWRQILRDSSLVASGAEILAGVSKPRPLVLDARDRLYLWRYFTAERRLAARLRGLAVAGRPIAEPGRVADLFRRLFPAAAEESEIDFQAAAAVAALGSPLALVSGGPGTGKTTTVVRLLALAAAAWPGLRIALAAPTGKAAARLEEAIAAQLETLGELLGEHLENALPRHAATLHRTLGYSPRQDRFRYHSRRPLTCDLLVIDEASMVDLLMMDAVVGALRSDARLVLLGDRDQLASVDTGFVFGDLCTAAGLGHELGDEITAGTDPPLAPGLARAYGDLTGRTVEPAEARSFRPPLDGCGVELRISYRFRSQPGIGSLASALRAGAGERAVAVLDDPSFGEVRRQDPPAVAGQVVEPILDALTSYFASDSPAAALKRLETFRILSATRIGRWGSERLNALVEARLDAMGLCDGAAFYRGRPILVESNDYQVKLYNGDLGVCWPEDDHIWAFFTDAANPGALRRIALAKLPPHVTAWAMTVHKSQGSELDHVLLVLGDDDPGGRLSRELIYTGITRARRRVDVIATPSLIIDAANRSSRRVTGLTEALALADDSEADANRRGPGS